MGVVSFAWILSGILALCVLWLRAIGLFGRRPDLSQVAWQGSASVLLMAFGVLTNLPGQSDYQPYLVSEFVEGVTLADLLTTRRPSFREAAEVIAAPSRAS
jgi:hypothetical protein